MFLFILDVAIHVSSGALFRSSLIWISSPISHLFKLTLFSLASGVNIRDDWWTAAKVWGLSVRWGVEQAAQPWGKGLPATGGVITCLPYIARSDVTVKCKLLKWKREKKRMFSCFNKGVLFHLRCRGVVSELRFHGKYLICHLVWFIEKRVHVFL